MFDTLRKIFKKEYVKIWEEMGGVSTNYDGYSNIDPFGEDIVEEMGKESPEIEFKKKHLRVDLKVSNWVREFNQYFQDVEGRVPDMVSILRFLKFYEGLAKEE